MEINSIGNLSSATKLAPINGTQPQSTSFIDTLGNAINEINRLQKNADDATTKLALGEPIDIHTVMLAAEEANLSLQLAIQVRNKLVEAYQEIMRMQV